MYEVRQVTNDCGYTEYLIVNRLTGEILVTTEYLGSACQVASDLNFKIRF
jgi:hypothetical protein